MADKFWVIGKLSITEQSNWQLIVQNISAKRIGDGYFPKPGSVVKCKSSLLQMVPRLDSRSRIQMIPLLPMTLYDQSCFRLK